MNKETIKSALSAIPTGDFLEKSKALLATMGYRSERTLELSGTVHDKTLGSIPITDTSFNNSPSTDFPF